MMDFLFKKPDQSNRNCLLQGDLLTNTGELKNAISQAHKYYADTANYTHFVILTQSCDLVRRTARKTFKAPYLTIAVAKPFRVLLSSILEKYQIKDIVYPVKIYDRARKNEAERLLERLLHNEESGYFYIPKNKNIPNLLEDICVYLPLSIALKKDHYDACLNAKIGEMDDIFSAKLGWLKGNIYSRVATPAIEETLSEDHATQYKQKFFSDALDNDAIWLANEQCKILKEKVGADAPKDTDEALNWAKDLPQKLDIAATEIIEMLKRNHCLAESKEHSALMQLKNLRTFKKLFSE